MKDDTDEVKQAEDASRADRTTGNKRETDEDGVSESATVIAVEEMVGTTDSSVNEEETAAPGPETQQQLGDKSATAAAVEISPEENSVDSENPDKSEAEQGGEENPTSSSSFTPPANPPPDPPPVSEPLEDSGPFTRWGLILLRLMSNSYSV